MGEEEIKMKKSNVHPSFPRAVTAPSPKRTKGQLFCNHHFSPPDCRTSEACAKSEQNLKIPEVKEAEILIGNNLGLRGNWVPFKFSYLEGVCVCGHSDNVVTGLMTAPTIWDISVAESTEQAFQFILYGT